MASQDLDLESRDMEEIDECMFVVFFNVVFFSYLVKQYFKHCNC